MSQPSVSNVERASGLGGITMDETQLSALRKLIEHDFYHELRHYLESDEADKKTHIFNEIMKLNNWLVGMKCMHCQKDINNAPILLGCITFCSEKCKQNMSDEGWF